MKHTTSILSSFSMALLLCYGCSSIDETEPTDIPTTYITFGQPQLKFGDAVNTRATLMTTDELNEFTVCGFCVPQNVDDFSKIDYSQASASWSSKSKFCRPNVFDGNTTKVTKNGSAWTYQNVKQWTSPFNEENKQYATSAQFTFLAWANGDFSLDDFSTQKPTAPLLRFNMPFQGGTQDKPIDCNLENIKDALIAERFDHTSVEGPVPFEFEHILTGIRFQIANYSNDPLTIKSMKLSGEFFRSATFSYEKASYDQNVDQNDLYWGSFTIVDESNPVDIPANTKGRVIGKTDENPDGLTLLLLPDPDVDPNDPNEKNKALGYNKKVVFDYILNGEEYTVPIDIHLSYVPKKSTRHIATFNFLGKNQFYLVFKPITDVWEDGSNDTITIN